MMAAVINILTVVVTVVRAVLMCNFIFIVCRPGLSPALLLTCV